MIDITLKHDYLNKHFLIFVGNVTRFFICLHSIYTSRIFVASIYYAIIWLIKIQ